MVNLPNDNTHSSHLNLLLQEITNNDGNPGVFEDSQPDEFNFSAMSPSRIFTMAGEQYRYLENMGSDNHMIIRNEAIRNVSWNDHDAALVSWYDGLDSAVQAMVQPVANNFTTGTVSHADVTFDGPFDRWIPNNLDDFPEVEADVTQVDTSGTPRAFSLSLADVTRFSGPGLAFPSPGERLGASNTWWHLRTPTSAVGSWIVDSRWFGSTLTSADVTHANNGGGPRPALIINQAN